jgi:hypothetical protein
MRKAIVMVILAIISRSAVAEWKVIGTTETYTIYADSGTIRKTGNTVKMWDLFDYKAIQVRSKKGSYMSLKRQQEYDCKEERSRTLATIYHSGRMAEGKIVDTDFESDNSIPVPPGTANGVLMELACAKE